MIYLGIASIIISTFSLVFSIGVYQLTKDKEESKATDPYKPWRDPQTGLLRARKVDKL